MGTISDSYMKLSGIGGWGLGSNGTKNRVKDLRRELDGHVPGVHRLAQHGVTPTFVQ